jgi:hypothetical protein
VGPTDFGGSSPDFPEQLLFPSSLHIISMIWLVVMEPLDGFWMDQTKRPSPAFLSIAAAMCLMWSALTTLPPQPSGGTSMPTLILPE